MHMPVVLKIDSRRKIVYSTFYGKVGDEEIIRHGATIASDPDFKREFNEIVDFSAVKEFSLSDATLLKMANTPSLYRESVRHIIIASTDQTFQMASRYKKLVSKSRPNLFVVRSRAEAYEMLGLSQD